MKESGLDRLAYYLGVSRSWQALLLPAAFLAGGFCLAYFLPLLDVRMPGGAPVMQVILEGIWFFLMAGCFLPLRKRFRQKYGERAYQQLALRFFLPAGILMMAGIVRPIWVVGHVLGAEGLCFIFGFYFLAVGILLEIKGARSLGIDRVTFVYTVFPEKGELVDSALYQYLRHPLYAAMSHIAVGIGLLAGTVEGLLCSLIFVLKLMFWSKIEEKELIARLGQRYENYRKKVPAFVPQWGTLWNFWWSLLLKPR